MTSSFPQNVPIQTNVNTNANFQTSASSSAINVSIPMQRIPIISSVSTPIHTQVTSATQPLVSYSIGSTYSHQNANLGLTNTTSTTQPKMGLHITYFMVPSGMHNTQNYNNGTFQQAPSYAITNPFLRHTQTQGVPLTQIDILTQQL